jgi:hypothetical protein
MKKLPFKIIALILTIVAASCSKDDSTTVPAKEPDVYVAGFKYGYDDTGNQKAIYWKNGKEVELTNGNNYAEASDIFVVGNDVYVAGAEVDPASQRSVAKFWKNGQPTILTDLGLGSEAVRVIVENGIVYVAGTVTESYTDANNNKQTRVKPVYWKNGAAPVDLTDGVGTAFLSIYYKGSFCVSNGVVYLVGGEFGGVNNLIGLKLKYWKNGVATIVKDVTNTDVKIVGFCIYVSGQDTYIGGIEENRNSGKRAVKYWKNNSENLLPEDPDVFPEPNSIVVDNNDVYVAARVDYWKNGQNPLRLTNDRGKLIYSNLFLHKKDLYVAGAFNNSEYTAAYYKNGIQTILSPESFRKYNVFASSIFVLD